MPVTLRERRPTSCVRLADRIVTIGAGAGSARGGGGEGVVVGSGPGEGESDGSGKGAVAAGPTSGAAATGRVGPAVTARATTAASTRCQAAGRRDSGARDAVAPLPRRGRGAARRLPVRQRTTVVGMVSDRAPDGNRRVAAGSVPSPEAGASQRSLNREATMTTKHTQRLLKRPFVKLRGR